MKTIKNCTNLLQKFSCLVSLLIFLFVCFYAKQTFSLCGDVSGDNLILSNDVLMVARASIGILTLDSNQLSRADVYVSGAPDGLILSNDLLIIARASLGMVIPKCAGSTCSVVCCSASDCTGSTPYCSNENTSSSQCVQCTSASQCQSGYTCENNVCKSPNTAPTITSTAIATATVGTAYTYDVNASDADGDTLTYSLTTKPTGMTINSTTGVISWTPTAAGSYNMTASVSDGKGDVITQSWTIIVVVPACVTDADCNDSNSNTTDKCFSPNTFSAFCANIARSRVFAGEEHTCTILSDGGVKCWGKNNYGQLGLGTSTGPERCPDGHDCSTTPLSVTGISNAVSVSTARGYTCAVLSDGSVKCWGKNYDGRLGDGSTTDSSTPVSVSGISNAITITAQYEHTCALLSDSNIKCWGYNEYGQLGDGSTIDSLIPVLVTGISNAVSISAGMAHTCALLLDGSVKCWGWNLQGGLGNGSTTASSTPVSVTGINNAVSITAGDLHTCALLSDGSVKCWGENDGGQLGIGTYTGPQSCGALYCSTTPVSVTGISNAVNIIAGNDHTCAVLSDSSIKCWGNSGRGQLGNGTSTGPESCYQGYACSTTPLSATGINNAVSVTAGENTTCTVLSDSSIKCWGYNAYGQLGNGTTTDSTIPVSVLLTNHNPTIISTAITSASVGTAYTYDINATDTDNDSITYSLTTKPTDMTINSTTGVISWTPTAAGSYNMTASVSDGRGGIVTQSWTVIVVVPACVTDTDCNDSNSNTTDKCFSPNTFSAFCANITPNRIAAGDSHTCAILSDSTIKCWGENRNGELGNGSTADSSTPVSVTGISNAVSISAGSALTCALLLDGTIKCWGGNVDGELGIGTDAGPESCSYSDCSTTPVSVTGISNAISVSASSPTCAVLLDRTIKCWGSNGYGQLGDGSTTNSSTPVSVSGINNAVSVTAGGGHTCALLSDSSVKCWGYNNFDELGDTTRDRFTETCNSYPCSTTPVSVTGINNAVSVTAGDDHTCAILSDGSVKCWGWNGYGQLGTTANYLMQASILGISNAVRITAGESHTCALLSDSSVKCWAGNNFGQLGNGTSTGPESCSSGACNTAPVSVSGISNAVSVTAGEDHTCAVLSDSSIKCWGKNYYGQLGNGSSTGPETCGSNSYACSTTPVSVIGIP